MSTLSGPWADLGALYRCRIASVPSISTVTARSFEPITVDSAGYSADSMTVDSGVEVLDRLEYRFRERRCHWSAPRAARADGAWGESDRRPAVERRMRRTRRRRADRFRGLGGATASRSVASFQPHYPHEEFRNYGQLLPRPATWSPKGVVFTRAHRSRLAHRSRYSSSPASGTTKASGSAAHAAMSTAAGSR